MSTAFSSQAKISESADKVWTILTDWDQAHHWMPGTDWLRADGATAVGTKLTFHARGKDRPSMIAAIDHGHSIVLRSTQGGVTADYRYQVEAVDENSCVVELVADCRTSGAWSLAGPLLRGVMRRTDGKQLELLKKHIESGQ